MHSGKTGPETRGISLVDAHHHFWNLHENYYPWLADRPDHQFFLGNYDRIKKNYLPADYLRDAGRHRILGTVHCEAEWDRADQVGETQWLTSLHGTTGLPSAIVAHAWFHTPDAAQVLERHAAYPLVRGIRSKPVTASSPNDIRYGTAGSMTDPAWLNGFSLLQKHGFSWDLRVPYWHLYEAAEVARQFPMIPIALNHTGFPWDRSIDGIEAWQKAMEILARQPNVHVKISEFGLKEASWDYEENRQLVLRAVGVFGIERCMFASNFPVAGLRISYEALVDAVSRMMSEFPERERHGFFVRNASDFYRLNLPT